MFFLQALAVVLGIALVVTVLRDAFETIVLPRRPTGRMRLTVVFYRVTWGITRRLALRSGGGRREVILSYYGPLWMISLVATWAVIIVAAFGFIHWGLGSEIVATFSDGEPGFWLDIYMSGTTLFTLGMGDVAPRTAEARLVAVVEAGLGLGFLALVIGYLPVLYSAFSRRETLISLFDARAGSPPTAHELIRRFGGRTDPSDLNRTLEEFERWSAELLESHLSYPVLAYYRSQHDRQSWLAAITTVLDSTAVLMAAEDARFSAQAQLTFAMARHTVIDLAQVFGVRVDNGEGSRLDSATASELWAVASSAGMARAGQPGFESRLRDLAATYEREVASIAGHLVLPLPAWLPQTGSHDDWETNLDEVH